MYTERRKSLVSLDILGWLFSSPDKLTRVIPSGHRVKNVEAVSWQPIMLLPRLVARMEAAGYEVDHFHSSVGLAKRDGLWDFLKILVGQLVVTPPAPLVRLFREKPILVHAPVVTKRFVETMRQLHPKGVYVEIHDTGKNGIRKMEHAVHMLRDARVPARGIFDGAHYLGGDKLTASPSVFRRAFTTMLYDRQNLTIAGDHIPIGFNPRDAYPWRDMPISMWRDYQSVTRVDDDFVALELQYPRYLLRLPSKRTESIRSWFTPIFDTLQRARIVDFGI